MEGACVPGALLLCVLLLPLAHPSDQVPDCQVVRSSFQSLSPGVKWTPDSPVLGVDLQVCQPKGLTCCSRKMEERYQAAARQSMESRLQTSSAQLKLLIIQNAAVFQEAFEMVLRHGRNSTLLMLREEFPGLGGGANAAVGQLFLDISLYILGSDSSVDDMVTSFFTRLFPLAYRRLLGPSEGAAVSEECLRGAWRDAGAFGSYPKLMMTRLSRSLLATRVFLQALNLGIEVVNTTVHLRPGRDCGRALLRLWYCPHCQGLLAARPCRGFCLSVMQGCLGGAAEVQPHWRGYVEGLAALGGAMRGEQDMETVVLRLHALVRLALRHALAARSRLVTMVSGMCAYSQRVSRSVAPPADRTPASTGHRSPKPVPFDPEETLAGRRREFINSLKSFSTFYGGLGEALCSRDPAMLNDSLCWNGQEVTDRFPGSKRVPTHSSEAKHRGPEPVISQIIDKLKHINQLLRLVTVPERRWRARPGAGGAERGRGGRDDEEEEGLVSGDCDDEDECSEVSGLGPPPRRKRLRIFADLADNSAMDDLTFHEQLLTPRLATDAEGGESVPGGTRGLWGPDKPLPGVAVLLTVLLILLRLH
ncbi:glypican-3 [Megalops cyprinoides]|uniref:glypican-3 n=1 Tax=Megalops cyprinoides TaxID=118141 RepID=UPI001863C0FA|nr:glypican-3 [Megalops cyprinoides]